MHHFYKLLPLLLLLFAPGCIPFAYIKPDVDIYHASLPTPGNDGSVAVFEVKESFTNASKTPFVDTGIVQLRLDSPQIRQLSIGSDTGFGMVGDMHLYHDFDSRLKIYRRGCHTQTVSSGVFLQGEDWKRCQSVEEREIAIDSLTRIAIPQQPLEAIEFPTQEERKAMYPVNFKRVTAFSVETLLFLIAEYDHLASISPGDNDSQPAKQRQVDKAARLRERLSKRLGGHANATTADN